MFSDLNFGAIIGLAIAYVAFGALWYSPKLFGRCWMECCGIKEDEMKECCGTRCYLLAFLGALVTVFALALFVEWTNSFTFAEGAAVGFWAWLGFIVTNYFSAMVWSKMNVKEFLIHVGYSLISFVIIGGLLAIW